MRARSLRAVLYDWDGTLLNSAETSFRCYVRLFGSFGIRFERSDFERAYSPDWYRTYVVLGLPEERWAEADARWLRLYAEEQAELVPGARAALAGVSERGLQQALVTSGSRERILSDLTALDVHGFFGAMVCSEDAANRKPHPEALLLGLQRLSVAPGEAAYVGDSPEDIAMARAAGVFAVGIPGGFPNRDALRAAAPDLLAADLAEVLERLLG